MRSHYVPVILICLALVLFPFAAKAARPVVISGKVTDTRGRAISSALVTVPALSASTLSDTHGMYRLVIRSRVHTGQQVVVRASRKGFDYASRSVVLSREAHLAADFRLAPVR